MKPVQCEDGTVEYWSIWSNYSGYKFFDCPKKALEYMRTAMDIYDSGIQFHKERDGVSVLSDN